MDNTIDTIVTDSSYTLAANELNLTLTGTANVSGTGNAADNVITGNAGNNALAGGGGNDTFQLNSGDVNGLDQFDGGAGVDTIKGSWSYDTLHVTDGLTNLQGVEVIDGGDGAWWNNVIIASAGNDNLDFSGMEVRDFIIDGGAGNDTITGTNGDDHIRGGAGDDILNGGGGNDTFLLTTGGDTDGNDIYDGGTGVNSIVGGWSYDTLHVANQLTNLVNIQVLDGGDATWSNNVILATEGNDTLDFSAYQVNNFIIDGGAGNDTITGTSAGDYIRGGSGDDVLNGAGGDDTFLLVSGGDVNGTDQYNGGTGINSIIGGWSYDVLRVVDRLANLVDIQVIDGGDSTLGYNTIVATAGDDILDFSGKTVTNFIIDGGLGNDTITGTAGADYIRGGAGNDVLTGGAGDDVLIGGDGNDTFLLSTGGDLSGFDYFDGGTGSNKILGGWSYDILRGTSNLDNLKNIQSLDGGGNWAYNAILGTAGNDVFDFSGRTVRNFFVDTGAGNDIITGTSGVDYLSGGAGNDVLNGGGGNDVFLLTTGGDLSGFDTYNGGSGVNGIVGGWSYDVLHVNDQLANLKNIQVLDGGDASWAYNTVLATDASETLNFSRISLRNFSIDGAGGNDAITGSNGADYITGGAGNDIVDGAAGADLLWGGAGHEMFVGGADNDEIYTGSDANLIAFNVGDGQDVVHAVSGTGNALSLGQLASYGELAFSKVGNDLVLSVGADDGVTLKDWYGATGNRNLVTLQVLTESMTDYAPGSADVLRDQRVERFDFGTLVSGFDQALAANPALSSWSLTNSLLDAHLSGSNSAALGGDLAYQYGTTYNLTSVGIAATQSILQDAAFVSQEQALTGL